MERSFIIKLPEYFEPVEDKSGYYWINKRNYLIASEKVLRKAFKDYENRNKLLLSDKKF